jgi:hypothetical protein
MDREPAVIVAGVTAVLTAVVAVVVAWLPVSDDQQAALLGLVGAAAPIIAGLVIRGKVYSPSTVQAITEGTTTT